MSTNVKKTRNSKTVKKSKKAGGTKAKRDIYEIYKAWSFLPAFWKGLSADSLRSEYGIEDEAMIALLQLKTQGDFAKQYKVRPETLTRWNARMESEGLDPLDTIRGWANKLNKNVIQAHYKKLIKKFDPVSADIWYKVVGGFNEKKTLEHSGKLSVLELIAQSDNDDSDQE